MSGKKNTKAESGRLTPKQKKFANIYVETFNGTHAAIEAGYSPRSAAQQACENLKKPNVQAYIRTRIQETDALADIRGAEVDAFLRRIVRGEEKDAFGLDAALADRIKAGEILLKRYDALKQDGKNGTDVTIRLAPELEKYAT